MSTEKDYEMGQQDERKRSGLLIADAYDKGREDAARDVAALPRPGVHHKDWVYVDHAVAAARGAKR